MNSSIITDSDNSSANPLERKLSSILQPVRPRREFVNQLKHRIQVTRRPAFVERFTQAQFILILLAGILSGVTLMVMFARFLVNLLGGRKIS